ncbi:hypothetical protein C8R44DRAFT_762181 [Mycena epipterygia]|nr:hypothetical protein C8R44DRAFT_762181 [Mycena epipterygia]
MIFIDWWEAEISSLAKGNLNVSKVWRQLNVPHPDTRSFIMRKDLRILSSVASETVAPSSSKINATAPKFLAIAIANRLHVLGHPQIHRSLRTLSP